MRCCSALQPDKSCLRCQRWHSSQSPHKPLRVRTHNPKIRMRHSRPHRPQNGHELKYRRPRRYEDSCSAFFQAGFEQIGYRLPHSLSKPRTSVGIYALQQRSHPPKLPPLSESVKVSCECSGWIIGLLMHGWEHSGKITDEGSYAACRV